jgi:hypothetical protein
MELDLGEEEEETVIAISRRECRCFAHLQGRYTVGWRGGKIIVYTLLCVYCTLLFYAIVKYCIVIISIYNQSMPICLLRLILQCV